MTIYEKLQKIQMELEVPKNQFNAFGKYNYRSCEDILAAVKPVAEKHGCVVKVSDDMVEVGGRCYIEATAWLIDCTVEPNGDDELPSTFATGFAREEETKKGMDAAQITGSASSYARKYALNGLFCLDDVKDPDSTNRHGKNGATSEDWEAITESEIEEAVNATCCEKCKSSMTTGQITISKKNYDGHLYCPACQKEVK